MLIKHRFKIALETRYQKLLSKTQFNIENEDITPGCKFQIKKKHEHITGQTNKIEKKAALSFWSLTRLRFLHLPLSSKVLFCLCNKATSWPRAFFCRSSSLRSTRIFNCKHSLSFFYGKKHKLKKKKNSIAQKQFHKKVIGGKEKTGQD